MKSNDLFNTSIDVRIIGFFIEHPTTRFYVRELAKELKISPSAASRGLKSLAQQGFITRVLEGREAYYALMKDKPLVQHLAISYFLLKLEQFRLVEKLLSIDNNILSVTLYGSMASGNYDEESDLDLLIISNVSKDKFCTQIKGLEASLKREVLPTILTPIEWLKLAKKKDAFYLDILKNHVLVCGNRLAVG